MQYKQVLDDKDIAELMSVFSHFHDSVVKEIIYTSGSFVNEERGFIPNKQRKEHNYSIAKSSCFISDS